jgi:hypothetical protein
MVSVPFDNLQVREAVVPLFSSVTVTEQVAVLLPSSVLTAIVAVPSDTAVTRPVADTVATDGLLLLQTTFLLAALEGETVAVNCSVAPTTNESVILFKDMPVTEMTGAVTVTSQLALLFPSAVVTVIVA